MHKWFFLLLFSCITHLSASSINFYNDSPFPLTVEIIAADGTSKGVVKIAPQHLTIWQDPVTGSTVWSQTPYTAIFTCAKGEVFGVYSGISPGATINALDSKGNRYCKPEKKKEDSTFDKVTPGKPYSNPNLGPPP